MAKSGKDVKKTAEKKKKIIHPKSREAKRQNRQMERADHVGKKKLAHAKLAQLKRTKLEWFHANMDPAKELYTENEMVELIREYISRHDVEIEFLKSFQRSGEPLVSSKANKVLQLEQCQAEERLMLEKSGFEAPNVTTPKLMQKFREWDCTLQHMQDGVPLKIYKARPHAGDASGKPQHSDAMDM